MLDVAKTYAINNFLEIIQDANFYQIPLEELENIIRQSTLNVQSEEQVYQAVIKWVKTEESRIQGKMIFRLLQHVRLPLAKPQFLLDVVQTEPLVRQCR